MELIEDLDTRHNNDAALSRPLSVCTSQLTDVPIEDVAKFASRPESARRKEAQFRHGSVARPLNSFMLYRKAYLQRAKSWCKHNKQQHLSQTLAASWRIESPEVRQYYQGCAILEQDNHAKTYPDYKFSPKKARSRRAMPLRCTKKNSTSIVPRKIENEPHAPLALRQQELGLDSACGNDSSAALPRMPEGACCGPIYSYDFTYSDGVHMPQKLNECGSPTLYGYGVCQEYMHDSYGYSFPCLGNLTWCFACPYCAQFFMIGQGAYGTCNEYPYTYMYAQEPDFIPHEPSSKEVMAASSLTDRPFLYCNDKFSHAQSLQ